MSSDNIPNTSGRNHHATVYYDYNTFKDERDSYSKKVSFLNENASQFSWWKSMSMDNDLWDIVEDNIEIEAKKNRYPKKGPIFNGNAAQFSLWKNEMFNHIMSIDAEMWNIVENRIDFEVNIKGMALDKNVLTETQKQLYRKKHRVCEIFVEALPSSEYMKIIDKSTANTIFKSLCSNYEERQHNRKAKDNCVKHLQITESLERLFQKDSDSDS